MIRFSSSSSTFSLRSVSSRKARTISTRAISQATNTPRPRNDIRNSPRNSTTSTRVILPRFASLRTQAPPFITMAPIPKTMSGILIEETGGVDVLRWKTDLPVPELKEGEILVKNEYIGVNFVDTYFRTGLYKTSLPFITGREAAGEVVATHASVTGFKPGDKVASMTERAYAEFTAVPASKALHVPAGVTTEQAAASLLQGLTALTLIREAAGIRQGQGFGVSEQPFALVHAAAGGTGSQLVQMLHAFGVKVIGTAGSAEKREVALKYGAVHVLDSHLGNAELAAKVKEITGGHGVDVVFDGVGKATFDMDLEVIARKGTLIIFGNASGATPPVDPFKLMPKNIKLMRPAVHNYLVTEEEWRQHTTELFQLLQSGKIDAKIHEVYPLKEVARAHSDLEGRKTAGKLLLKL